MAKSDTATKSGSAGLAVLDYVRSQADQLREHEPLVRQDAPDAVHRMRVAARRLRSALQAYRRVLDRSRTDELVERLRWLGRELTDARDSEVTERRLIGGLDALPDELVLGPVSAQVTRTMGRRHTAGVARARAALDSERYRRLHEMIDELLARPPLTPRARRPARRELPRAVGRAWRRTAARMEATWAAPAGAERDHELHEARKAAKRLRYAVEIAQPSVGKPAKRMRRRLKSVHTLLGDHQDAVVARPVIRELAAQAHLEGGNGFTHGVLHGQQVLRAYQAERELPGAWARLRRRKHTRWLKR